MLSICLLLRFCFWKTLYLDLDFISKLSSSLSKKRNQVSSSCKTMAPRDTWVDGPWSCVSVYLKKTLYIYCSQRVDQGFGLIDLIYEYTCNMWKTFQYKKIPERIYYWLTTSLASIIFLRTKINIEKWSMLNSSRNQKQTFYRQTNLTISL